VRSIDTLQSDVDALRQLLAAKEADVVEQRRPAKRQLSAAARKDRLEELLCACSDQGGDECNGPAIKYATADSGRLSRVAEERRSWLVGQAQSWQADDNAAIVAAVQALQPLDYPGSKASPSWLPRVYESRPTPSRPPAATPQLPTRKRNGLLHLGVPPGPAGPLGSWQPDGGAAALPLADSFTKLHSPYRPPASLQVVTPASARPRTTPGGMRSQYQASRQWTSPRSKQHERALLLRSLQGRRGSSIALSEGQPQRERPHSSPLMRRPI